MDASSATDAPIAMRRWIRCILLSPLIGRRSRSARPIDVLCRCCAGASLRQGVKSFARQTPGIKGPVAKRVVICRRLAARRPRVVVVLVAFEGIDVSVDEH